MCAINGFNWKDGDLILKMNKATSSRGPDGTGVFLKEKITLGHNRLSIIDLSEAASQPMKSNDDKLIISFNGEIYNFPELKSDLASFYNFQTKSDTEVILAAYKKWGKNCVKYFNGIFALAIWDEEKQELFLARDHAGIKPLYYFNKDKKFIFSSEIKGILVHNIPRKISKTALSLYFHLLYTPGPQTLFEGIMKFPPAHTGIIKEGYLELEPYTPEAYISNSKKNKNLENIIDEAVERQIISDRPVGVYLSGGIDSTILVDALSKKHQDINTFSVGFELEENEEEGKFNADFLLARQTAKHYKTKHNELLLSSKDVVDLFKKAVKEMEEPVSNPTIIAMLALSHFAKKKVAVALSGDGGDELFGGYDRYRLSLWASYYSRLPRFIRQVLETFSFLKKANIQAGLPRFKRLMFQKENDWKNILKDQSLYSDQTSDRFFLENFKEKLQSFDFEKALMDIDRKTWLIDEALLRSDKMSMANGLEIRVPFLDPKVIEAAENLPTSEKISLFKTKIALRKAYKDRLPLFVLNQPKRGWFSPGAKWLRREDVKKLAYEVLSPAYCKSTSNIFKWNEVISILEAHISKKGYNLNLIWAIMTFQIWAKQFEAEFED